MSENKKPPERTTEELSDEAILAGQAAQQPHLLFILDSVRYESLQVLEQRGSGEVLLLVQRRLHARGPAGLVTVRSLRSPIKFVRRQRLVDEVTLAFLLHHPAIAQVHHFTVHRGVPHIIMEYVDGPSLDTVLNLVAMCERPVSPSFALYVASEVADALHHAHTLKDDKGVSLGIIHRDVSPRNIRLDAHGAVKLTHFGAAYSLIVGREETPELLLKGDVAYASPEYFSGLPLTPASDVFSLGLVLVELLTGRHLFLREEEESEAMLLFERPGAPTPQPEETPSLPFGLMSAVMERYEPVDLEWALEGQPEPLQRILRKCLQRVAADRYATAAELRDATRAALAQVPRLYGRKEASEELSRLISEASAVRDRVELPQGELFPGHLEAHELSSEKGRA